MSELVGPADLLDAANRVRAAHGSPPIAPLLPGLTPSTIRTTVQELAPELSPLIDKTIEHWWSIHDGQDPSRISEGTGPEVTSDGLSLVSLRRSLKNLAFRPADRSDLFFPLSRSEMGTAHWLTKPQLDSPWFIEIAFDDESGMCPPHRKPNGEPVLFDDYLRWAIQAEWVPPAIYPVDGAQS